MTYRKVGGLHFWRVGRLGGSFYIASINESNSREDFILRKVASLNFAIAAYAWSTIAWWN